MSLEAGSWASQMARRDSISSPGHTGADGLQDMPGDSKLVFYSSLSTHSAMLVALLTDQLWSALNRSGHGVHIWSGVSWGEEWMGLINSMGTNQTLLVDHRQMPPA
jgi:hypothetical protein